MSKTAFTVRVYSYYLFLLGAALMLIPNVILPLFGFAATSEIWIRMLGLFTCTAGIYYFQSAAHEQTAFFRATIVGRLFFFVATATMTIAFGQPVTLAAIGCVDLFGALWTLSTLRQT